MTWAVANRFHFTEAEMLAMPLSRLIYWHDGHLHICDEEEKRYGVKT